jgi:hypothetical protein
MQQLFIVPLFTFNCLLMGYRVRNPKIPLIPHIPSSPANTCMRHESACFSPNKMHRFKYRLVRLSLIRILMLIFPQCSETISIAKAMHEMHICKLRIRKSRHFLLSLFLLPVLSKTNDMFSLPASTIFQCGDPVKRA